MTNETLRKNILSICQAEIGTTENPMGSNKTKYGEWYGMNGVAWCCIAVSWIFDSAGVVLKVGKNPKGFAHTQEIINYATKHNLFTDTPKAGDIVMLDFKNDKFCDHIGIFKEFVTGTRSVMCYEGNTSSGVRGSQDNGGGFYLRMRKQEFVYKYINVDHFLNGKVLAK